jgi:hypothetical protein
MASHQKWGVRKQVSVGAGRGNEDSFRDDCSFCFARVGCNKCVKFPYLSGYTSLQFPLGIR